MNANADSRLIKAKRLVVDYFNRHVEKTENFKLTEDQVFIVWFVKVLQHWKALVSTTVPDSMYYEVTYNGDKHESYVDAYKKFANECVSDLNYDEMIEKERN